MAVGNYHKYNVINVLQLSSFERHTNTANKPCKYIALKDMKIAIEGTEAGGMEGGNFREQLFRRGRAWKLPSRPYVRGWGRLN